MTNDVEKRWDRPGTFRAAAIYAGVVVALAALAFAVYAVTSKTSVVAASSVPVILFLGGVGAFVKTYQLWKARGVWVAWQGAGWFLLVLMLVSLPIPGAAIMAT
jgi:NADH:ubiquinone oxidoreductase subunit H